MPGSWIWFDGGIMHGRWTLRGVWGCGKVWLGGHNRWRVTFWGTGKFLVGETLRVDRVSPGQFPSVFLPSPGPVPGPGRPGPGSTRRAGPGLETLGESVGL